jgi:hypothetical protein
MSTLTSKIKNCQTSKELDLLRVEIIQVANNGEDFTMLQSAFIKQKNKLKRNGHTANAEGYSMLQVVREQRKQQEAAEDER